MPTGCSAGSTPPGAGTPRLLKASEGSASPTSSGNGSRCDINPHEETLRADTVCVMGLMEKPRDPVLATISEVSATTVLWWEDPPPGGRPRLSCSGTLPVYATLHDQQPAGSSVPLWVRHVRAGCLGAGMRSSLASWLHGWLCWHLFLACDGVAICVTHCLLCWGPAAV